jgi:NitT/TauT family transport system substrate-binding protein
MVFGVTFSLTGCNNYDYLTSVRLNEVVRSVFYAPQYVALEQGFFEAEGLDIDLATGWGADASMTALVSDNADIALMGPEASIYVYNEGLEDYAVSFAQLTQRAGNFLVGREPIEDFDISMLAGSTIVGGRTGGMPEMVLEYILKSNGLEPFEDVDIITNIDFTATASSFAAGTGDYTAEFEPTASSLEEQGMYVVASLGVESGKVPYTAYMATKDYMAENGDIIQSFTNAIYEGQKWVANHSSREIAEVILPYFPDTDLDTLEKVIERYKAQETWCENPVFEEEAFDLLQDILSTAGELEEYAPYEDLVTTDYAKGVEE